MKAKTLASGSDKYPVITLQPKDIFRNIDDKADFTMTAEKSESADSQNILEYKWQKLTIKDYYSTEWTDITKQSSNWTDTENGEYTSVFNAAYFAKDGLINSANAEYLDRTVYRCVVTESVYGATGEAISACVVISLLLLIVSVLVIYFCTKNDKRDSIHNSE